ncbi:Putative effector of murein hydrolase [Verrucomicrobium sp. GAS474]|uniref:LrgB family protein n=1 Tax=Verrucomicrobium sp. GAS474 TaxID=1882831 RepID=UPI00087D1BCC|nr:LrgB family protein [Verrucomicrobium sp. GAS474]SDT89580.1 Putative effector of murein hydrolase [Verrucomicrobium sp. GAS474]
MNVVVPLLWIGITLAFYVAALRLYRRHRRWWTAPLLVTWLLCGLLLFLSRTPYPEYLRGAHWFVFLLGPATVAFALPVYRQRALIRHHGRTIAAGVVAGSLASLGSGWALAHLLHLPPEIEASLLPRSVTTPFALAVSERLGGIPELTASLTAATGLFGAAIGEGFLQWLPLRSKLAAGFGLGLRSVSCSFTSGAMLGMGAHGAGVARARERGDEAAAIAGLVMIFAGLLNVAGATLYVLARS